MNITAKAVGYAAVVTALLMFFQHKRENMLTLKLSADVLWTLHYVLIARYSAAAVTFIAIFREIVYFNNDKSWAKSKLWVLMFIMLFSSSAFLTWQNAFSILPAFATVITTIAFDNKSVFKTKIISFFASLSMLVYGLHCASSAVVTNEIITETAIITVFILDYIKNRRQSNAFK